MWGWKLTFWDFLKNTLPHIAWTIITSCWGGWVGGWVRRSVTKRDRVGWVGQKRPFSAWRNYAMAPYWLCGVMLSCRLIAHGGLSAGGKQCRARLVVGWVAVTEQGLSHMHGSISTKVLIRMTLTGEWLDDYRKVGIYSDLDGRLNILGFWTDHIVGRHDMTPPDGRRTGISI